MTNLWLVAVIILIVMYGIVRLFSFTREQYFVRKLSQRKDKMIKTKQTFDDYFKTWRIFLPVSHLYRRREGSIRKRGWRVNYKFGVESEVEYLEYFASHRMTNDRLYRIYEDGTKDLVNYCNDFYPVDEDAQQAYLEHDQRFYNEVKQRGLL